MDLPFLNNEPPAENAGADFWNFGGQPGEGGGLGDDVTLNELLALYQSANEASPPFPPVSEPEAYPAPVDAPAAPAAAAPEAPAATPFVPSEPVQSSPWGGDAPAATPYVPSEPVQSSPWGEAPAAPTADAAEAQAATPFVPSEPVQSTPWGADTMAPPQPMAWETAGDATAPTFDIPSEPIFAAPPAEPPAPVFEAPEPEPLFPEPAPIVTPEPVVEVAPVVAPPVVAPPVEPVAAKKVVPAIKVEPIAVSLTPVGDLALASPEARREASGKIGTIATELAQGIDAIQEQLNVTYEQLATAAASRAPVTDIVSLTSSLSEIKGQISEDSPIYQHALALRQMADAYLELLKSL